MIFRVVSAEYLDRVFRRVASAPEFADDWPSGENSRNPRESARLVPHGSEVWSTPHGHRSAVRYVRVFRCRTSRDGCVALRPSCDSRAGRNPLISTQSSPNGRRFDQGSTFCIRAVRQRRVSTSSSNSRATSSRSEKPHITSRPVPGTGMEPLNPSPLNMWKPSGESEPFSKQ